MERPESLVKLIVAILIAVASIFGYNLVIKFKDNKPVEITVPYKGGTITLVDSTQKTLLTVDSLGKIHVDDSLKNKAIAELLKQSLSFRDSFYLYATRFYISQQILMYIDTNGKVINKPKFDSAVKIYKTMR